MCSKISAGICETNYFSLSWPRLCISKDRNHSVLLTGSRFHSDLIKRSVYDSLCHPTCPHHLTSSLTCAAALPVITVLLPAAPSMEERMPLFVREKIRGVGGIKPCLNLLLTCRLHLLMCWTDS
ncbi:hypothetical protein CRENBAI_006470 [Crenichthys baileyi]|uniref:Uncharacterized protein n=1 Tax=Crenichthys baileyi TaxID=28760 RepID=A0AAV9S7Z3_9TELE